MSFLDTLRAAVSTARVQLNVFLIEYKPGVRSVFALLEGRDDPSFYRRFISSKLPNGYQLRLVNCGSRNGVIDAVSDFSRRYGHDPRVIALIDKDHTDMVLGSPTVNYPHAFETCFYSIENYVCDALTVRRYCVEMLGLPDMDPICDHIQEQFKIGLTQFHSAATRCMAWIVAARRRGDKIHLRDLNFAKIFSVDDDISTIAILSNEQLYRHIEKITGINSPTPAVSEINVDSIMIELSNVNAKKWLRGKQEIWFTVTFINKLAPAIQAKNVRASSRVVLTSGNALSLLSALCDIPADLDAFLTAAFFNL